MLLDKGSDLKPQNSETGNTCLHYCLEGPHEEWFDFLVKSYPQKVIDCINVMDNSGFTGGLEISCNGFSKIYHFLERFLMEHIDIKNS